jgi:ribokinase
LKIDFIGFGSLNLDEFWEVPGQFLKATGLSPGSEYVRELKWFSEIYPELTRAGVKKAADPGGSAANTIAALRRMGFTTGYYGAVGKDDLAEMRLSDLGEPDNLKISLTDLPSGRCLSLIQEDDDAKDRTLVVSPNANDTVGEQGLDIEYFKQCRWVHMTSFVSEGPLESQIKLAENLPSGVKISFDPGAIYCATHPKAITPILRRTTLLFITKEELSELTGLSSTTEAISKLLGMGVPMILLKKGLDGVTLYTEKQKLHQSVITPERIVDRTGAGDVAAAGFLAGWELSGDLGLCLYLAVAAASKSVEGYGREAYPDRCFVERTIAEYKSGAHMPNK